MSIFLENVYIFFVSNRYIYNIYINANFVASKFSFARDLEIFLDITSYS